MPIVNLDDLLPQHVASPIKRNWSPFQQAIFDAQRDNVQNLLIEAVAGSGKTTTLVELMRLANNRVCFLAFNKSIAEELKSRVYGGTVMTLNALGHRILTTKRPGARLNRWKTANWLRANMSFHLYEEIGSQIARMVSIAKGAAFGIGSIPEVEDFQTIIEDFCLDMDPDLMWDAAKLAHRAFFKMTEPSDEFDFDDQLWIPIAEGWTFPTFDTIYVDEAQDLNYIQHLMLSALADKGARVIAVGDRRQAIYGFRGALTSSMDILRDRFSMAELPLSITYRCSQAVTTLAQSIVPQITAREGAPMGEVAHLNESLQPAQFPRDSLVVCRNNFPIFNLALQFIKANLPCRVMSAFLEEMEKWINTFKASSPDVLAKRLDDWIKIQRDRYVHNPMRLEAAEDRYEVVHALAISHTTMSGVIGTIRKLTTSTEGPRISTVHRAKGLEAPTTYILRYDLMPSPKASTEEQMIQEQNLRYVAITRAQNNLHILPYEG